LQKEIIEFSSYSNDGRINSCMDEDKIIKLLISEFKDRIIKPKFRMWYDILLFDYLYGWIPVNIKSTTMLTSDNTGNLTMCVYAYTNQILDINTKKDYYFIVFNKNDSNDIIINSLKGLNILTPNINNLPFQICWNKNRLFIYGKIKDKVKLFIDCLKKTKTKLERNIYD